jgi:hypothetical protein
MKLPTQLYNLTTKITLLVFVLTLVLTKSVSAASFYLNPATGTIDTQNFTLSVTVDTEDTSDVSLTKAYITYDTNAVTVNSISNGSFDNYTIKEIDEAAGIITIEGELVIVPGENAILQLADIYFTAKTNNANTNVTFLLTNPYESQILNGLGENALVNTTDASIYISTPISVTNNSSSTYVPNTGSYDNLVFIGLALFVASSSLLLRKYAVSKL